MSQLSRSFTAVVWRPRLSVAALAALLAACADSPMQVAPPGGPRPNAVVNALSTITVTTTANAGPGSLRQAIADAAANTSPDVITFAIESGDTGCTAAGVCTISLGNVLSITDAYPVTIDGGGANMVVSGGRQTQVLVATVQSGATIQNITIEDGLTRGYGGCIVNLGTMTLRDVIIQRCTTSFDGGAIATEVGSTLSLERVRLLSNAARDGSAILSYGTTTIVDAELSGNVTSGTGGAAVSASQLLTKNSSITVERTLFAENVAVSGIGAIAVQDRVPLTIRNSTFSANLGKPSATPGEFTANAIAATGAQVTLEFVTIQQNADIAGNAVGIIASPITPTSVELRSSIINGGCDVSVSVNSTTVGPSFADKGCGGLPVLASNVNLGPLSDNGGRTRTHALLAGSAALDVTPIGVNGCGGTNATDQRGLSFARLVNAGCDAGAFEVQARTPVFSGFLSPVKPAVVTRMTGGRALPINFALGGDFGLTPFASGYPAFLPVSCPGTSVARYLVPTNSTSTGVKSSKLNYNVTTGQYTYLWATPKVSTPTCINVEFMFAGENKLYTFIAELVR